MRNVPPQTAPRSHYRPRPRTLRRFLQGSALLVTAGGLLLAGISARGEAPEGDPPLSPGRSGALQTGETLHFVVRYGIIKAGTASLETRGIRGPGGRPAWQVISTATSNAVFDKFYPVRDRIMSVMAFDTLRSLYFEKHLREGTYRTDQAIRFDHDRAVATYQDGREYPITRGTYDVISAFYRLRTMPLEVGKKYFLDSHADRKNYPIRVSVTGREEIETQAGRFRCLVVEPTLRSGAFFKNEGKLTIWLTDDVRRIPVQMRSKIPVGSITVELTSFERPEAEETTGGLSPDAASAATSTR